VNQPPIWQPLLVQSSGLILNWPLSASHSSCPPPYCTQAISSLAVKPNGMAEKKYSAGDLLAK
jgi:hypothetical protein